MKTCAVITVFNADYSQLGQNIRRILEYCEIVYLLNNSARELPIVMQNVRIICNRRNIGISAAINVALIQAQKDGFTQALLFDQDSFMLKEMFLKMEQEFISLSQGRKTLCIGPSLRVRGVFIPIPRWSLRSSLMTCNSKSVFHIITSGMLLNIAESLTLNGFDERFPVDFCDFVFCWKGISKGYNIYQSTDSFIEHEIGNNSLKIFGSIIHLHAYYRNYFLVRDTLNICLRMKETPLLIRFRFISLLPIRIMFFLLILDSKSKRLKMMSIGFLDFICNQRYFGKIASILGNDIK